MDEVPDGELGDDDARAGMEGEDVCVAAERAPRLQVERVLLRRADSARAPMAGRRRWPGGKAFRSEREKGEDRNSDGQIRMG